MTMRARACVCAYAPCNMRKLALTLCNATLQVSAWGILHRARTMHRGAIGIKCIYRAQIIPDLGPYRAPPHDYWPCLTLIDFNTRVLARRDRKELRAISSLAAIYNVFNERAEWKIYYAFIRAIRIALKQGQRKIAIVPAHYLSRVNYVSWCIYHEQNYTRSDVKTHIYTYVYIYFFFSTTETVLIREAAEW